jgi:hypothetical protein
MLACLLGRNREIFFPKLGEEQMMTFSAIADKFLAALGYVPRYCTSEEEARKAAFERTENEKQYPVYYFKSDTTGEKSFEEFYVPGEHLDLTRFNALGIIDSVKPRPRAELDGFLKRLEDILAKKETTKAEIVEVMRAYLPNFIHEEKGKNLDQKM